ncbi:MAG TPA: hypothetical protein VHE61_04345 [Opitutaceae bacterium]|nr:hypothetical protein [Opitutaceae bacterium]
MNRNRDRSRRAPPQRAYVLVLMVLILVFVGVVAAMQVLILTSVGTTSRAFDSYRQGVAEQIRLERVVTEAVMDQRQISAAEPTSTLSSAVADRLAQLTAESGAVVPTLIPGQLPSVNVFPAVTGTADPLTITPTDLAAYLSPELSVLLGPRVAAYPEAVFEFASRRTVLDATRTYRTQVRARMIAVPLTRFAIMAYDLPAELAATTAVVGSGPVLTSPAGLVPSRDAAFIGDLRSQDGTLPYHYRRRAALACAYQYVFSQKFVDLVAEYAGITHFCDLGAAAGTAVLEGMTRSGGLANWDLSRAGGGSFGGVTMIRDASVVFTEAPGSSLRLSDSDPGAGAFPIIILLLGPSDTAKGPLNLSLGSITRPVVIIGYNVRMAVDSGAIINGALFLDPASSLTASGPVRVGHLSYWAGSTNVIPTGLACGDMPSQAEALAPRVMYVATIATRL